LVVREQMLPTRAPGRGSTARERDNERIYGTGLVDDALQRVGGGGEVGSPQPRPGDR
jgi:hypothetical protein